MNYVWTWILLFLLFIIFYRRSSHLPPIHCQHDGEREAVSVAVHRVQDVHPVRHQRERRQAPVLWRLRPRLPHVLPRTAHEGGARGILELPHLYRDIPHQEDVGTAEKIAPGGVIIIITCFVVYTVSNSKRLFVIIGLRFIEPLPMMPVLLLLATFQLQTFRSLKSPTEPMFGDIRSRYFFYAVL